VAPLLVPLTSRNRRLALRLARTALLGLPSDCSSDSSSSPTNCGDHQRCTGRLSTWPRFGNYECRITQTVKIDVPFHRSFISRGRSFPLSSPVQKKTSTRLQVQRHG